MAKGDIISYVGTVASGAYLDLLPSGSIEWVIHNIFHEADVELYFYDGTNNCLVDTDSSGGGWLGFFFHCNNGKYWRIKNTNASTKMVGYDGIVSRV